MRDICWFILNPKSNKFFFKISLLFIWGTTVFYSCYEEKSTHIKRTEEYMRHNLTYIDTIRLTGDDYVPLTKNNVIYIEYDSLFKSHLISNINKSKEFSYKDYQYRLKSDTSILFKDLVIKLYYIERICLGNDCELSFVYSDIFGLLSIIDIVELIEVTIVSEKKVSYDISALIEYIIEEGIKNEPLPPPLDEKSYR